MYMGRTTYARPGPEGPEASKPAATVAVLADAAALARATSPTGPTVPASADAIARDGREPRVARARPIAELDLDIRLSFLVGSLRWAAISLGFLVVATRNPPRPSLLLAGASLACFGVFETLWPARLHPPGRTLRVVVAIEAILVTVVVAATGGFTSPFVLALAVPSILAGYAFARRMMFVVGTVGTATIGGVVALQAHDPQTQRAAAELGLLLLLCGVLGAFTRRLVDELGMHQEAVADHVERLTTANELLVALHGVAQTLPASLDLREVVESTRTRLRSLFSFGSLVILVRDDVRDQWTVELAEGLRIPRQLRGDLLAAPLQAVLDQGRAVLEANLLRGNDGIGCSPMARSGMYAPLRTRGRVVGLMAIEDTVTARYGPDDLALLGGLTGPLALAVDNAIWFLRLRRFGAEAERARIARELHDRLAQSLAYVAFELERLSVRSRDDDRRALTELHEVVRDIVGELRETLYQLRAGVSEDEDLDRVAQEYLTRYEERTGIIVHWRSRVDQRVPYQVEQELWRILQEALTNVEHHAQADACAIDYRVADGRAQLVIEDTGRGFDVGQATGEHYGLVGMHERADALGAQLEVRSEPGAGTRISVELEVPQ